MIFFITDRNKNDQVFPYPDDNETVMQNPPCFIWLSAGREIVFHVIVYRGTEIVWEGYTKENYILPRCTFAPGEYTWNIFAGSEERGIKHFSISENALNFIPPDADEIYDSIPDVHPRTLFFKEDIAGIRLSKVKLDALKRNAEAAYKDGLFDYPRFHFDPEALPYREYFGRYRDYCDRDMTALALLYSILDDKKAGEQAKKLFIHICSMTPHGACSLTGGYGDEIGLSNARILPCVYDLIYPLLDEAEKNMAEWTIYTYAEECEYRLKRLNYSQNPGSSHAGRLPAYLGECAMALRYSPVADEQTIKRWIKYSSDIYSGIFPYYGCEDGGWAEGAFYASSYTKWYLPFFCEILRFTGKSFADKPFYHNFIKFAIHFLNPDYELHPFGDGYWCHSSDKEWPGFFAQNPFRVYADLFGDDYAKKLEKNSDIQEIYNLHLVDLFLPEVLEKYKKKNSVCQVKNNEIFPKSGFISLHSDINDIEDDFACQIRCSRYGSESHRHADQGSFALFYRGKALINPSGYFGRKYGTLHHKNWTNTTKAHNALLFNGTGQYENSFMCYGRIINYEEHEEKVSALVDCSDAYPVNIKWKRLFEKTENELTITDDIESPEAVNITYPLHSSCKFVKNREGQIFCGADNELHIDMQTKYDGCLITDRPDVDLNEGENEKYHVDMPVQYHMYFEFKNVKCIKIICSYKLNKDVCKAQERGKNE